MVAIFVIILTFNVLHFCQAQSNENCAVTKADALGMENGSKSRRVIGGRNTTYAPWQVALVAGVNKSQRNSILLFW